jgi:hypothetical protein
MRGAFSSVEIWAAEKVAPVDEINMEEYINAIKDLGF